MVRIDSAWRSYWPRRTSAVWSVTFCVFTVPSCASIVAIRVEVTWRSFSSRWTTRSTSATIF
jgi:TRAP-type mannitol/chloroaromatic compound transport system permease small subunit